MLFSAAFFYLFISFWAVFFSYHIQFLFFFSLNLEAAKLPIILLFLFFSLQCQQYLVLFWDPEHLDQWD